MKKPLLIINIASLIGALIWLMIDNTWEPLVTSLGLVGSLITLIYSNSNAQPEIRMTQKGGKKSKNYQSAGDLNIQNKK